MSDVLDMLRLAEHAGEDGCLVCDTFGAHFRDCRMAKVLAELDPEFWAREIPDAETEAHGIEWSRNHPDATMNDAFKHFYSDSKVADLAYGDRLFLGLVRK